MSGPAADRVPGRAPGSRTVAALARAAAAEPFTARALRELLFCLVQVPFIVPIPLAGFGVTVELLWLTTPARPPNPSWPDLLAGGMAAALVVLLLVVTGAARGLGSLQRRLTVLFLSERIAVPSPVRPGHGMLSGLSTRLRDGPGWRAVAYLALKLPVTLLEFYTAFWWVGGLVNLSYPFWWRSFRNHPPAAHLSPVPVFTPFGWFGQGMLHVATFPGTFAAFGAGAAMLLTAPWVTRAATSADRWLIRGLLGPGGLAQRVADLEQTRSLAVDDSAALLRRMERDLHDGAQIRLATLAMNLGMAKEKLGGHGSAVLDATAVRELVDAAHQGAKDALSELRSLARGIHPPVLDTGLADALATLAASSAIPTELAVSIPVRPTPAIETIAYFCAAELLANAAKHSSANQIKVEIKVEIKASATERDRMLILAVSDDGVGGADPARGSGLAGLAQRVRTVDGRLGIASPPGGPTQITIELPLRA